jgi:putative aldouronate transport system permease protein
MKKTLGKRIKANAGLLLLALPSVIFIFIFNYLPLYGLILPFKNLNYELGFFKSPWAGLNNFRFLFNSNDILIATRNTLLYNFAFIFIGTFCSVVTALMLFELSKKFTKVYQTVLFFPYFLSWVIVSYICTALFDVDYGILNKIFVMMGKEPLLWYSDTRFWPLIIVVVAVWKGLGYGSVLYYAAMTGFNPEYYEASRIDGATKLQQIRRITIPLLKPFIIMMIILQIGKIFYSDFGLFYYVPRESSLLLPVTNVIDTYVYRVLRLNGDIGMSSAAGFYQSVVGFVLVLAANRIVNRIDSESALF